MNWEYMITEHPIGSSGAFKNQVIVNELNKHGDAT
jgi:hypothetical protein